MQVINQINDCIYGSVAFNALDILVDTVSNT